MVDVDNGGLTSSEVSLLGLRVCSRIGAVLHSSDEPGELSKCDVKYIKVH